MAVVIPQHRVRERAGLIAIERALRIGQACDAAGKHERRRTPVGRVLIIAGDPRVARDIFPIREEWRDAGSQAAELVTGIQKQTWTEAMRPMDASINSELIRGIEETEQVRVVCARILEREAAVELILVAQRFAETRFESILVGRADDRDLIVVAGTRGKIRKRIELQ